MKQAILAVTLVVPDYDAALGFYVGKLRFRVLEDTRLSPQMRFVRVPPPGAAETSLLLAREADPIQAHAVEAQFGGRVFLFLGTDDFDRDYRKMIAAGVDFLEQPRRESYGKVAVFRDPFGNKWDLVEPAAGLS